MSPDLIVVVGNPVRCLLFQARKRRPRTGMDQLLLIRREERFGYSIIVTDPGPSEGSPDIVLRAVLIEHRRRVLAAAVRMKYHTGRGLRGGKGHVESGGDRAGPHRRGDSPADSLARVKVDD